MFIIGNGRLITHDELNPFFHNGAVVVEGNKVIEVGETESIRKKYPEDEFIDARGQLIMPGMINTHHHIYSAFARGMTSTGPAPKNFVDILENMWWKVDKNLELEDVKYSALTTYIDSVKNGVTTVFDHHASPMAAKDSLFTIAEAAKEIGIRTCLCYEVSDRDGIEILEEGIKENTDFIRHYNTGDQNMIKGMFGMHASFTLSSESLDKCVKAMEGLDAGYHIHTAEAIDDLYDSQEKYSKRVVERLDEYGLLGEKSIAVHCIHVDEVEMGILKRNGTQVVHNPESNMGNAVGCSPALELISKGINVGLGTDGYTSDMFESMKVANIIHKHVKKDPAVAWGETPQMVFENNRRIVAKYFEGNIGVLKEGAVADIIVADYDPLTPMDETNYNGHILFGLMGRSVNTTIIDGKIVMKDRKLVGIDEERVMKESREHASKMWQRLNG
ncbi:chlorohydrolase [Propionigenium maris DSM 9537]|uniref:Chlorohydrolase n=1 Tax=Propionigenium maris DSM 9537 TaxID=1123000 RepID=A0A9W6GIT4_9FUSO|nr:putative aminohydrolase SsnA [Propionigenium maris]GLI54641.1 chlorohydrolase [Propionigenium maris DSM 9537]